MLNQFAKVKSLKNINLIKASKFISSTSLSNIQNEAKFIQNHNWNQNVSEAEKIVEYPKSVFSFIFNELGNSNHPLLKKVKNLMYDGQYNMNSFGLIVLLISKAAGHASHIPDLEEYKSAGVLHSQRALAEVTEMIRTSTLVHQGMVNLQTLDRSGNELAADSELIVRNKIAVLIGDYLIGNACFQLAELRNQDLFELILSGLKDQAESNFIGDRDDDNIALPSNPALKINLIDSKLLDDFENTRDIDLSLIMGHPEREWNFRHSLSSGKLLGKSCQGTLKLAGQSKALQKHGYTFGKHLALAYQASMDLEPFKLQELPLTITFSLVSAPVLFHLDYDPSLYEEIKKGKKSVTNIDFRKIHKIVADGPGIDETKELQRKHGEIAMDVLNEFPDSDARTTLQNMFLSME
ncbi:all trans-polyprenyl-diphosphate synthase PDSS2-like [Chironomus tepperi]|uniref:all trans-polyprenyl-diphosphate synthase PDSS2-like n=1 Tax=Chironomus tepperi TaxID=113505 RepID=UPI00391EE641